jgi:hypothetical protein
MNVNVPSSIPPFNGTYTVGEQSDISGNLTNAGGQLAILITLD